MINHHVVPLPNGNFLLKAYWSDGDERIRVQTTEVTAEDAYTIADQINSTRQITGNPEAVGENEPTP